MKFSIQLLAVCAAIMAVAPGTSAQTPTLSTKPPITPTPTAITSTTTTTTIIVHTTTTIPIPPATTDPIITTTLPPITTPPVVVPPVVPSTTRTFSQSIITVSSTPGAPTTCVSSADCPINNICRLLNATSTAGTCQPLNSSDQLCPASPAQPCNVHADCRTPAFSFCAVEPSTNRTVCAGFGAPGTATECKNGTAGTGINNTNNTNSVTKTLTYAGIAVGGIAVLGIVFALVRWQRRRQRSKMPKSMFGEVDYGVSNRHSTGLGASSAAAAGGGGGGGDQYPFSSRPHAQEDNYNYDDNYYESPAGYNNMHPMTGMAGGAKMNDPYYSQGQGQDQYYDDQYYAKEGYNNNGYDQNGQYVGNDQDGFYDAQNMASAAGYDNYQYDQYGNQYDQYGQYTDQQGLQGAHAAPGQQGYSLSDGAAAPGRAGVAVPPEAVVRTTSPRHQATGDYAMDHYAVEPSELDFGGNNNAGAQGHGRKY
ncbi:hypothetical protein CPB97_002969 [Podila verticillata]|nr:hypothetical protein CPB97_002969 [Podila verticillata]